MNRTPPLGRRIFIAFHRLVFGRSTFDGLELYFERPSLDRVRESLQLVKDADPLRWRRLQRYMPLMVETYGGSAFNRVWRAAFIDVSKKNSWRLAGSIVHELTHAYLFSRWRLPYRGDLRQRHEMICLKEELRLYRRFIAAFDCDEAEGKQWLAWVEGSHRRGLEKRWWERSRWQQFVLAWRDLRKRELERESAKHRG